MPNNVVLSSVVCYLVGLLLLLPGYVFQNNLQKFHNNLKPTMQFIFRIFFIYVISFAVVLEWRGKYIYR
jgi:hypothetical protein